MEVASGDCPRFPETEGLPGMRAFSSETGQCQANWTVSLPGESNLQGWPQGGWHQEARPCRGAS